MASKKLLRFLVSAFPLPRWQYRQLFARAANRPDWVADTTPARLAVVPRSRAQRISTALLLAVMSVSEGGLGLWPKQAHAAPIADPRAPIVFRPHITLTNQGVPVVNIAAPNANGISYNQYERFDIDVLGLILNNSQRSGGSLLGGYVNANPNLQNRTASLIINEVTSSFASALNGSLEVFGMPAGVIIANPNGILCNGCGMTNAPSFTLTTGRVQLLKDGAASSFDTASGVAYDVQGGQIDFKGLGMEATRGRVDIIAERIGIDAPIYGSDQLNLIAGRQTVDADKPAPAGNSGPQPTGASGGYAIDATKFGALTAGQINIIVSGSGVGVRSDASMAATAGDVHINAQGDVMLRDVAAARDVVIHANGALTPGQVTAVRDIELAANGDLRLTQGVEAGRDLRATAGANLTVASNLVSGGTTQLRSGGDANISGAVRANGGLDVDAGRDLTLSGQALTSANATFNAGGTLNISGALQGRDVTLQTGGDLNFSGASQVAGNLELSAGGNLRNAGTLTVENNITLSAGSNVELTGTTQAGGNIALTAGRDVVVSNVLASGSVSATAGNNIVVQGGVRSGADVSLSAGSQVNVSGDVTAIRNISASANAIDIKGATNAGGDVNLTARAGGIHLGGGLTPTTPTAVSAAGNVQLRSTTAVSVNGSVTANGDVTIAGQQRVEVNGSVIAGAAKPAPATVKAEAARGFDPAPRVAGPFDPSLVSGQVTLQSASGDVQVTGDVYGRTGVTVQAPGPVSIGGALQAGDRDNVAALSVDTNAWLSTGRAITSTGDTDIRANAGIYSSGLNVGGNARLATTHGSVQIAGDVNVVGSLNASTNTWRSTGDINIGRSATLAVNGLEWLGRVRVGELFDVRSVGRVLLGELAAGSAQITSMTGAVDVSGRLETRSSLQLNAQNGASFASTVIAGDGLRVNGGIGDVTFADSVNAGSASLVGRDIRLAGRTEVNGDLGLSASRAIDVRGDVLTRGTISAQGAGDVSFAGEINTRGDLNVRSTTGDVALQATYTAGNTTVSAGRDARFASTTSALGSVSVDAARDVRFDGVVAVGTVSQRSGDLNVRAGGSIAAANPLDVVGNTTLTASEDIRITGATAGGAFTANAGRDFDNRAGLDAGGDATITAGARILHSNEIRVGGNLKEEAGGDIAHGAATAALGSISLASRGSLALFGDITSPGTVTVSGRQDATIFGDVLSQDPAAFSATLGTVRITGTVTAERGLAINAGQDAIVCCGVRTGDSAGTAANVDIRAGRDVLAGGDIISTGDVRLDAGRAVDVEGRIIAAGELNATARGGELRVRGGIETTGLTIDAAGQLTLDGTTIVTRSTPSSTTQGNATITARNGVQIENMEVAGNLQLNSTGDTLVSAGLAVGGTTALNTSGALALRGDSTFAGAAQLNAGSDITLDGSVNFLAASNLNSAGGGILSNGVLYSAKPLALTALNDIRLAGTTLADSTLTLTSQKGSIENLGLLYTLENFNINTAGNFVSSGSLHSDRDITLNAANIKLGGTVEAGGNLSATAVNQLQVDRFATLSTEGDLSLKATSPNGRIDLAGNLFALSSNPAAGRISLNAQSVNQTDGFVLGRALNVSGAHVQLDGATQVTGRAQITGDSGVNVRGTVTGADILINSRYGIGVGDSGAIVGKFVVLTAGSGAPGTTQNERDGFINNAGTIGSTGSLSVTAGTINNRDQITARGLLSVNAVNVDNQGVLGGVTGANINAVGRVQNSGTIATEKGDLRLVAATLGNGGLIYAGGVLDITASGRVDNTTRAECASGVICEKYRLTVGTLAAGTDLKITANSVFNEGRLLAGAIKDAPSANISIQAAGGITNSLHDRDGRSEANAGKPADQLVHETGVINGRNVTLSGGALNNTGLINATDGTVTVNVSGALTNNGNRTIIHGQTVALTGTTIENLDRAAISADDTLRLRAGTITNSGGYRTGSTPAGTSTVSLASTLAAGNLVDIRASTLFANNGVVLADTSQVENAGVKEFKHPNGRVVIDAPTIVNDKDGNILAPGSIDITTDRNLNGSGLIYSFGTLNYTQRDNNVNLAALNRVQAAGTFTINSAQITNQNNNWFASGNVLMNGNLKNDSGTISTPGTLHIKGNVDNTRGPVVTRALIDWGDHGIPDTIQKPFAEQYEKWRTTDEFESTNRSELIAGSIRVDGNLRNEASTVAAVGTNIKDVNGNNQHFPGNIVVDGTTTNVSHLLRTTWERWNPRTRSEEGGLIQGAFPATPDRIVLGIIQSDGAFTSNAPFDNNGLVVANNVALNAGGINGTLDLRIPTPLPPGDPGANPGNADKPAVVPPTLNVRGLQIAYDPTKYNIDPQFSNGAVNPNYNVTPVCNLTCQDNKPAVDPDNPTAEPPAPPKPPEINYAVGNPDNKPSNYLPNTNTVPSRPSLYGRPVLTLDGTPDLLSLFRPPLGLDPKADAPPGSISAQVLRVGGQQFVNTGFINVDTLQLDVKELINGRRLYQIEGQRYEQNSTDSWYVVNGETLEPGGVINANHWQIGEGVQRIFNRSGTWGGLTGDETSNAAFYSALKQQFGDNFFQEILTNPALRDYHDNNDGKHDDWKEFIAIIAAFAIAILCQACGATVLEALTGFQALGATATVINAAFVAAAISLTNSAIYGKFDFKTFLRSVLIASITAGALDYLGDITITIDDKPVALRNLGLGGVDGKDVVAWDQRIVKYLVQATVSTGIQGLVNGNTRGLEQAFLASLVNQAGADLAMTIGSTWKGEDQRFMNALAHATLGCAMAAAKRQECLDGAVGAVIAAVGNPYFDQLVGFDETKLKLLSGGVAALVVQAMGGNAQTGLDAALNETLNNYLSKPTIDRIKDALVTDCAGGNSATDACKAHIRVLELDSRTNRSGIDRCLAGQDCERTMTRIIDGARAISDLRDVIGAEATDRLLAMQFNDLLEASRNAQGVSREAIGRALTGMGLIALAAGGAALTTYVAAELAVAVGAACTTIRSAQCQATVAPIGEAIAYAAAGVPQGHSNVVNTIGAAGAALQLEARIASMLADSSAAQTELRPVITLLAREISALSAAERNALTFANLNNIDEFTTVLQKMPLVSHVLSRGVNDGKLGEQLILQLLKEANPNLEFMVVQNASGHGPDILALDAATGQLFHIPVRSSVAGTPRDVGPAGADYQRWMAEMLSSQSINKQPITDPAALAFLAEVRRHGGVDATVTHIGAQISIPRVGQTGQPTVTLFKWTPPPQIPK